MKVNEIFNQDGSFATDIFDFNKYIPINQKRILVNNVLMLCAENVNDFVKIDEFKKEIYFMTGALKEYANLEFSSDFDSMVEEYDMLCSSGCLAALTEEEDYKRLCALMEKEEKALLLQNSVEAQVAKVANSLIETIDQLSEKLEGSLGGINLGEILPEGTDITGLLNMIDLLK